MDDKYKKVKKRLVILAAIAIALAIVIVVIMLILGKNDKEKDTANVYNSADNTAGSTSEASSEGTSDSSTSEANSEISSDNTTTEASTETTSVSSTTEETTANTTEAEKTTETTEKVWDADSWVEDKLSKMSIRDKVCQMIITTPESLTGYSQCTSAGDATKEALEKYPIAGVIYFAYNLESRGQTSEMIGNMQSYAKDINGIPLFIAVDEEGGLVARVADNLGTTSFYDMYYYRDEGTGTAYNNAYTIASDIRSIGFNLDFAPVADTWSNSANEVIGTRAYSDNFEEAAELVGAAVKGFREGGVLCTLKHFPGHGDTAEDSHSGSAYSSKSLEELQNEEFLAFKSGIDAGADMVMIGHITMTGVDNLPAVFSYTIITEQLRGYLGFNGVVVTDALNMGAISNIYSSDEAAVRCIQAGVDLLLMPADLDTAVEGLVAAVERGEISEARLDQSVRRILRMKYYRLGTY